MIFFEASDTLITIPDSRRIFQDYLSLRSFQREEMHIDELLTEVFRLFYYDNQPVLFESCTPESDRDFWMKLYTFVLQHLGAHEAWSEYEIRLIQP
jgi:putative hydrolase of the HAD superfamily